MSVISFSRNIQTVNFFSFFQHELTSFFLIWFGLCFHENNVLPIFPFKMWKFSICAFFSSKETEGVFHLQKNSENLYWEFSFGKSAFHLSQVPFVHRPLSFASEFHANIHGTGDKDEKSVNGTQIFHLEVSTGKMGLPFQECRLFRENFQWNEPKSHVGKRSE